MKRLALTLAAMAIGCPSAQAQLAPRVEQLVAALRPALPFPGASADGQEPAEGGADARWFVVWPASSHDARVIVRANPLHPDVQAAGAAAMGKINQAVLAAELKAQADYERAVAKVRAGAGAADVDGVTLDDEGLAGERIDAELELTIELTDVESFELWTSEAPVVHAGTNGAAWLVTTAANTYRETTGPNPRERFRPAEARVYIGPFSRPSVTRRGRLPQFAVTLPPSLGSVAVQLRGNADLVDRVIRTADWSRLGTR